MTGVSATKTSPTLEREWTVEELKNAKPILLYFYVEGMDGKNSPDDASYKFSQSFELGGLSEKVIRKLNEGWRCKKVGIDINADRKQSKNQARIEFWSALGSRMGDVTVKESARLSSLEVDLNHMRDKNTALCQKEIKRIEAAQKARDKAEKESAAK